MGRAAMLDSGCGMTAGRHFGEPKDWGMMGDSDGTFVDGLSPTETGSHWDTTNGSQMGGGAMSECSAETPEAGLSVGTTGES